MLAQAGTDAQLLGCLIADGVKGRDAFESLPHGVRQGVVHHRLVDATIDAHPRVLALIERMPNRRFAAIALDIVWDYCLHHLPSVTPADGWQTLIARCHKVIQSAETLPASKAMLLNRMVNGRWLVRSSELDFVLDTIRGVGKQLRRPQDLSLLCHWVAAHLSLLEGAFASIWQDLWQHTHISPHD